MDEKLRKKRMIKARKIKGSLLHQLEIKGAKIELYESLIEDYMWFWMQEQEMQTDVGGRGRTYGAISAQGKEYEKSSPSVKDALMYSKQMIAILDTLELSTKTIVNLDAEKGGAECDLG